MLQIGSNNNNNAFRKQTDTYQQQQQYGLPMSVGLGELEEAVRELASEGAVTYISESQTLIIRSSGGGNGGNQY